MPREGEGQYRLTPILLGLLCCLWGLSWARNGLEGGGARRVVARRILDRWTALACWLLSSEVLQIWPAARVFLVVGSSIVANTAFRTCGCPGRGMNWLAFNEVQRCELRRGGALLRLSERRRNLECIQSKSHPSLFSLQLGSSSWPYPLPGMSTQLWLPGCSMMSRNGGHNGLSSDAVVVESNEWKKLRKGGGRLEPNAVIIQLAPEAMAARAFMPTVSLSLARRKGTRRIQFFSKATSPREERPSPVEQKGCP